MGRVVAAGGHPLIRRAVAVLLSLALCATIAPAPASAYPGQVGAFLDGSLSASVDIPLSLGRQYAGTLQVRSNATVVSGAVQLSGPPLDLPLQFSHSGVSGFPSGTLGGGADLSSGNLSLRLANGSTEFAGSSLDMGTHAGTSLDAGAVHLTGTSGTYLSPTVMWNGVSYGRLIANADIPPSSSLSLSIVDLSGAALQSDVLPGEPITVNGSTHPSFRIRAEMSAPSPGESPLLSRVGAGYVLADYGGPTAAARQVQLLRTTAAGYDLRQSLLNFTEYASNPLFGPAAGTWYVDGPETGAGIAVGNEIWLYAHGVNSAGKYAVGRLVSTNGGYGWSADASPVLSPTASAWDSGQILWPSILYEGGVYKMWYMGTVSWDVADIGYATSPDGINWTKYAGNPIFTNASGSAWDNYNVGWPQVVKVGSTYFMYYSGRVNTDARKSIGLATSTDGTNWTRHPSNPVINRGAISAGNYEATVADVFYRDGVFYLYWTCAATSSNYDTCVSTSTDGVTFAHFNLNPIITNGDGAWDALTAQTLTVVPDPLSGNEVGFFTGYSTGFKVSLARADPRREGPGTLETVWNLSGEVPHAFVRHELAVSTPPSTSVGSTVAVGPSPGAFGPSEPVASLDNDIATAPAAYLRHRVTLSTSNPANTPALFSSRIAYDVQASAGTFESEAIAASQPIVNATVELTRSAPAGTVVSMYLTNNGGADWFAAAPGVRLEFPTQGATFAYRLDLTGTPARAPVVLFVNGTLRIDARVRDAALEGADGSAIASVAGALGPPVVVPLDPAYFNSRIAPYAGGSPVIPVDFEVWVNASAAGTVRIDWVLLNLTYPDELRVYFAPDTPELYIEEGEAQAFRAVASTTPGVAITYAWELDGSPTPETGDRFVVPAPPGSAGTTRELAVSVTNGQFERNHTWTVHILPKPVFWVAKFYPAVEAVEVPVTLHQQFYVAVANASGIGIAINWTLDGAAAGQGNLFDYEAPGAAGFHTLSVSVEGAGERADFSWTIEVVAEPGTVLHQLDVTFEPSSPLNMTIGTEQTFTGTFAGPAPPDVVWEWRLDGAPVGGNAASYSYRAETAGRFTVSAFVHNATALAAHSWTVTVLPPPLPPPPAVAFTQPADGTTVASSRVRVDGTATPGSTLTVNGLRVDVSSGGVFTTEVTLHPGANQVVATARDGIGQTTTATLNVTYDAPPTGTTGPPEATGGLPMAALALVLAGAAGAFALLWYRERSRRRELGMAEEGAPPHA